MKFHCQRKLNCFKSFFIPLYYSKFIDELLAHNDVKLAIAIKTYLFETLNEYYKHNLRSSHS